MPENAMQFHLPTGPRGVPDPTLIDFLKQNRAGPVRISAAGVRRLDARMLQVLLSAAASWRERGLDFALCDVPAPVEQTLGQLGVTPGLLCREMAE